MQDTVRGMPSSPRSFAGVTLPAELFDISSHLGPEVSAGNQFLALGASRMAVSGVVVVLLDKAKLQAVVGRDVEAVLVDESAIFLPASGKGQVV